MAKFVVRHSAINVASSDGKTVTTHGRGKEVELSGEQAKRMVELGAVVPVADAESLSAEAEKAQKAADVAAEKAREAHAEAARVAAEQEANRAPAPAAKPAK